MYIVLGIREMLQIIVKCEMREKKITITLRRASERPLILPHNWRVHGFPVMPSNQQSTSKGSPLFWLAQSKYIRPLTGVGPLMTTPLL